MKDHDTLKDEAYAAYKAAEESGNKELAKKLYAEYVNVCYIKPANQFYC